MTPERKARNLLEYMEVENAQAYSAGELGLLSLMFVIVEEYRKLLLVDIKYDIEYFENAYSPMRAESIEKALRELKGIYNLYDVVSGQNHRDEGAGYVKS